jgi:hypothetical protein
MRTNGDGSADNFLNVPRSTEEPPGNPLSITDAFCIDAIDVDSSLEGEMKKVIDSTIADVMRIDDEWRQRYADTVIDFGCPYPPIDYTKHPYGRLVDEESYYDAYIYILPRERLTSYFNSEEFKRSATSSAHLTAEESSCSADACAQTAYGLYLTPEALSDPDLYLIDLCWAIGAGMPEETDWPPNVCNTHLTSPTP